MCHWILWVDLHLNSCAGQGSWWQRIGSPHCHPSPGIGSPHLSLKLPRHRPIRLLSLRLSLRSPTPFTAYPSSMISFLPSPHLSHFLCDSLKFNGHVTSAKIIWNPLPFLSSSSRSLASKSASENFSRSSICNLFHQFSATSFFCQFSCCWIINIFIQREAPFNPFFLIPRNFVSRFRYWQTSFSM